MTAEQISNYALGKILSEANIDKESTKVKFIYLGQLRTHHFFVLLVSPVDASHNAKEVKRAIKLLDDLGFEDLHWNHNFWDDKTLYHYYCRISEQALLNIK